MPITLPMRSAEAEDLVVGSHHHFIGDLDARDAASARSLQHAHSDDELELDASDVTIRLELDDVPLDSNNSTDAPRTTTASASPPPPASSHVEIAFSSSAGMFTYQMGVAAYIQDHFDVSDCRFSGCSGGSWAATLLAADTSVHKAWEVILATQKRLVPENYSWYSGYGRYASIVGATIEELWADDPLVYERVAQRHLHIAVTKFPSMQGELHNAWTSLEDLTKSILASSLVPFALSGRPYIEHRGQKYIDGCVSNFKGVNLPPSEYTTVSDLSFHAKKLVVDSTRSGLTALSSYLLPASLHKPLASLIYRALPNLTAPHDVIAPLSLTAGGPSSGSGVRDNLAARGSTAGAGAGATTQSRNVQRLLIRPWSFRGPSILSYHLTVDIATHQQHFDAGYKDAMENHHEFAAVLPLRQWPAAAA